MEKMNNYIQESIKLFDEDVSTKLSSASNEYIYKKLIQNPLY